ncbi:hypothetical protein LEP1GSC039_2637 [Leptospira santarosai str. 2000027870]|nr:hypothetical protein LEP1GSC039_2637 [Leptospira santarosai str. 2000027870]
MWELPRFKQLNLKRMYDCRATLEIGNSRILFLRKNDISKEILTSNSR